MHIGVPKQNYFEEGLTNTILQFHVFEKCAITLSLTGVIRNTIVWIEIRLYLINSHHCSYMPQLLYTNVRDNWLHPYANFGLRPFKTFRKYANARNHHHHIFSKQSRLCSL